MLQTQLVDLTFNGSVDSKTDSKNTLAANLLSARNVRTDQLSVFTPRGGVAYKALVSPSETVPAGPSFGAVSDGKTNIQFNSGSAWRVTDDATNSLIVGSEIRGKLSRTTLGPCNGAVSMATGDGKICTAWRDSIEAGINRIYVRVERQDGTVIVQGSEGFTNSTSTTDPFIRVVYLNLGFVILHCRDGVDLYAFRVNESESTVLSTMTLTAIAGNSRGRSVVSTGTALYMAIPTGNNVELSRYTMSGLALTQTATLTVSPGFGTFVYTHVNALSTNSLNGAVALTMSYAGGLSLRIYNSILTQVGSTTTVSIPSSVGGSPWSVLRDSDCIAFGSCRTQTVSNFVHERHYLSLLSNSLSSDAPITLGSNLAVTPFYLDSRLYACVETFTKPTYGSQGLIEYLPGKTFVDLAALFGVSQNLGEDRGPLRPSEPVVTASSILLPVSVVGSVETGTGPGILSVAARPVASFMALDVNKYPSKLVDSSNNQNLIIGNVPRDGSSSRGLGYSLPEITLQNSDFSKSVGSFSGVFSFVVAKVSVLPSGATYRSYTPIFTTTLTNETVLLTLSQGDVSTYGNPSASQTYIEVYRTVANGQILHRDSSTVVYGTSTSISCMQTLDVALTANRLADINGSELYPEPVGAIITGTQWKDRLAVVTADRPTVIKFDKPTTEKQGTCLADGLEIDVGTDGGNIQSIVAMDHTLYIFKSNSILTISGEPPGATGEGGSLTSPTVLRSGLGTIDPRTVLLTPRGIMFHSQKGVILIQRNQEWVFAGEGPYEYRTLAITGATIDVEQCEVYFTFAANVVWVYNYESNQWYRWDVPGQVYGAAMHNTTLMLSSSLGFGKYSKSATTDTSSPDTFDIPIDVSTGWIRPGHIRGFQRVKRMYLNARATMSDTLTVAVYTDYNTAPVQTRTFDFTTGENVQFNFHLAVQKCEAIRFEFVTTKASLELAGATLELGVKQAINNASTATIKG